MARTWYTIRDADASEIALWGNAIAATTARRGQRQLLVDGASSYKFDVTGRQLISTLTRLDSYDDRWEIPASVVLDDEAFAVEQTYVDALAALKGHEIPG